MGAQTLVIYGSGGFGREVAWLAESLTDTLRLCCFVDDDPARQGLVINDLPVLSFEQALEAHPDAVFTCAISNPHVREKLAARIQAAGRAFASLIHPGVAYSRWVTFGDGCIVCVGSSLTTNIRLGKQIQINPGCTVGHDVIMGDCCTLLPGARISGAVQMGKRVTVGAGAVILNGSPDAPILIGDDVVIGASACVTGPVEAGNTVVGIPARPLVKRIEEKH